ncbi:hypothetical protein [Bradyrhizobium sp.]|uniref:hypothetical protein n=1 Tax=Bradyrhizobium sp. TaxID=376 RepID=UPI00403780AF
MGALMRRYLKPGWARLGHCRYPQNSQLGIVMGVSFDPNAPPVEFEARNFIGKA